MDKVNLLTLLKDWHSRDNHPMVSFTSGYGPNSIDYSMKEDGAIGHIWYGDFDIAMIFSDRVLFAGWKKSGDPGWICRDIMAADPEFFEKLDGMLKYITGALS